MENLFENAKFGDIYLSNDGKKNVFCSFTVSGNDKLARLYREGWGVIISYLDGTVHSGTEFGKGIDFTIKERCDSLIDKACLIYYKELSEIMGILNRIGEELYGISELGELIHLEGSVKDFRKAMEE